MTAINGAEASIGGFCSSSHRYPSRWDIIIHSILPGYQRNLPAQGICLPVLQESITEKYKHVWGTFFSLSTRTERTDP